jgi:hypothetical protein
MPRRRSVSIGPTAENGDGTAQPGVPASGGLRTRLHSALARIPLADLRAELRTREQVVHDLTTRRQELTVELQTIDRQLALLSGPEPPSGPRRRPRNGDTLVTALARLLSGRTMSATEAADAVQRAGYQTVSRNFRTQVNIALIKSGRFRRTARGEYTAL